MEYRIKVIENHSGEKQFTPQYRYEGIFEPILIILYPILCIVALSRWDFSIIRDYLWEDIGEEMVVDKRGDFHLTESVPFVLDTIDKAQEKIDQHRAGLQKEVDERYRKEQELKMKSTKKTFYIKVK